MRKRSVLISTVYIALSMIYSSVFAQPLQIQTGLTWLNSAQTTTGNWPSVYTDEYSSTTAALDATYALESASSTYAAAFSG